MQNKNKKIEAPLSPRDQRNALYQLFYHYIDTIRVKKQYKHHTNVSIKFIYNTSKWVRQAAAYLVLKYRCCVDIAIWLASSLIVLTSDGKFEIINSDIEASLLTAHCINFRFTLTFVYDFDVVGC